MANQIFVQTGDMADSPNGILVTVEPGVDVSITRDDDGVSVYNADGEDVAYQSVDGKDYADDPNVNAISLRDDAIVDAVNINSVTIDISNSDGNLSATVTEGILASFTPVVMDNVDPRTDSAIFQANTALFEPGNGSGIDPSTVFDLPSNGQ